MQPTRNLMLHCIPFKKKKKGKYSILPHVKLTELYVMFSIDSFIFQCILLKSFQRLSSLPATVFDSHYYLLFYLGATQCEASLAFQHQILQLYDTIKKKKHSPSTAFFIIKITPPKPLTFYYSKPISEYYLSIAHFI